MEELQEAKEEIHVVNAYLCWHHLLHKKISELEDFLWTVKGDIRLAGMSSADANKFVEQKVDEIRTQLKAAKIKTKNKKK